MSRIWNPRNSIVFLLLLVVVGGPLGGYIYKNKRNAICTNNCNLLLISVDSLRADHMGTFGYSRDTTPNIDSLAKTGTLFTNYFTTSYLTPVSEMSVQTGMYPTANGITNFDTSLSQSVTTLPQYLKAQGYYSQALISSPEFLTYPSLKSSFSRDFDSYQNGAIGTETPLGGEPSRVFPNITSIASMLNTEKSKKTFTWLALGGVHWPYGADEPNIYADPGYKGVFMGRPLAWNIFQDIYKGILYPSKTPLSSADIQYVRDEYDNGVYAFDNYVGQIVTILKQQGLLNKTIIVIESEHGEDLDEHGYFAHYDVLGTQTHTPLLIVDPGAPKQQRVTSLVSGVDVLPTLLDLLNIATPKTVQGQSLVGYVKGTPPPNRQNIVFLERIPLWEEAISNISQAEAAKGIQISNTAHDEDIAIRTDQWLYVLRLSKPVLEKISWWQFISGQQLNFPDAELYNLQNDPGEHTNVIDKYPDEAAQLKERLLNWFGSVSANSPINQQNPSEIQPYF